MQGLSKRQRKALRRQEKARLRAQSQKPRQVKFIDGRATNEVLLFSNRERTWEDEFLAEWYSI